jgi:hypothetical protein
MHLALPGGRGCRASVRGAVAHVAHGSDAERIGRAPLKRLIKGGQVGRGDASAARLAR